MLTFKIDPNASYAVYLIDIVTGKVEGMHGIVPGNSVAGMLERSTSPASLRFERVA